MGILATHHYLCRGAPQPEGSPLHIASVPFSYGLRALGLPTSDIAAFEITRCAPSVKRNLSATSFWAERIPRRLSSSFSAFQL